MKIETKQKIKAVFEKYKAVIIGVSGVVVAILIVGILNPKSEETKVLPDADDEWAQKCTNENLLYPSGLPVFADDEQITVYSDALAEGYSVKDAEEDGFIVIERA